MFRFAEWEVLMRRVFVPHFKPATELEVMTGIINSELAGLRVDHIVGGRPQIRNPLVLGQEKQ